MTPDDAAFRAAIASAPLDDAPRLVYADWLDERGHPLGPVLRTEVAARHLLSRTDVHGVLEAEEHLHAGFTHDDLVCLQGLPWGEDVLRENSDSHVLVAGKSLSIAELRSTDPALFQEFSFEWYEDEAFIRVERTETRWYLFRKGPLPNSIGKGYRTQRRLLSPKEEIPRACEVAYMAALHARATGAWLLPELFVCCRDRTSYNSRVLIGQRSEGLQVSAWTGERGEPNVGLASMFRFSSS